ncbi:gluconate:H+ symporter [uncultured Metabacillus sp.]|uniref:GntT/GntP/DsdX family permease n=1 Tax=uncultured Metabacillus sp. TaxID=2860135 RepID=UPI00261E4ECD|nr:gluconate:H+ symporter [uncultured Metabacillus sp.]
MGDSVSVIVVAVLAIVLLLFLVLRVKMQEVLALLLVSIFVGIGVGMPPQEIYAAMEKGMGSTLGFLAVVIGLGAMFGEVLKVSGGAERLASTLFKKFGESKVNWSLGFVGMIVAVPIFFEVAIVIFAPLILSMARNSKKSILYFVLPLMAGIATTFSLIPPASGALAGATILGVDLGWHILLGAIVGIPAMIIGGPLFGSFIAKKMSVERAISEVAATVEAEVDSKREIPSFASVVWIILLPLFLMVAKTIAENVLAEDSMVRGILTLIGHPFGALTIVALLTIYLFGTKKGYSKLDIQQITTKALEPAGLIILITGAGSVFGEVLVSSGIGDIIANAVAGSSLPIIVFAYLTAALIRAAQGSGTVAIVTAASLILPIIKLQPVSEPMLALIIVAIGCGAIMTSHVNDSAFWMIKRYFGLTEIETLKSWTVATAIISIAGFILCLVISMFL